MIHRALKFKQSTWLKPYINFNTGKRKAAKNSFENDFFKLMNNAVFGKTMENLKKRVNIKLVITLTKATNLTAKPTFDSYKFFNENLVAVNLKKASLLLNKSAYIGMSELDIIQTLIYDFHYNFVKKEYGKKAQLLFMNTASLTSQNKTEDVYADFWADLKDKFDFSDYPDSSKFHDASNMRVIGKMKDEAAGNIITQFVGLRNKMYCYLTDSGENNKTAKGVRKVVIQNDPRHRDYKQTLFGNKQLHHKMKTISYFFP